MKNSRLFEAVKKRIKGNLCTGSGGFQSCSGAGGGPKPLKGKGSPWERAKTTAAARDAVLRKYWTPQDHFRTKEGARAAFNIDSTRRAAEEEGKSPAEIANRMRHDLRRARASIAGATAAAGNSRPIGTLAQKDVGTAMRNVLKRYIGIRKAQRTRERLRAAGKLDD